MEEQSEVATYLVPCIILRILELLFINQTSSAAGASKVVWLFFVSRGV